MSKTKTAVFLGGVAVKSSIESELAFDCGRIIGRYNYTLLHGGYNGLMEDVARGASIEGANVSALTLADKKEWGDFNPFVTKAIYARDFGQRLNNFFSSTDLVIAMGGGIGTLHEIASAIWYAGNIRSIPVIILGTRGKDLIEILKKEEWIYESPTRPLDFLHIANSAEELDTIFSSLNKLQITTKVENSTFLEQDVFRTAFINGEYTRSDGTNLQSYFDPFRLSSDPKLLNSISMLLITQVKSSIDAVAGIVLGGATLATHIAIILDKPLLLIRPTPKTYGTFAQVEGVASNGSNVLIVDDVVRNGTAMAKAHNVLIKSGLTSNEAVCILSYGNAGFNLLQKQEVILHSLFSR